MPIHDKIAIQVLVQESSKEQIQTVGRRFIQRLYENNLLHFDIEICSLLESFLEQIGVYENNWIPSVEHHLFGSIKESKNGNKSE